MKIVWNGKKGILNKKRAKYFEFNQELTIGNEKYDKDPFYQISHVISDMAGNIYACEISTGKIHKFDKTGNYILSTGKKGQGPGEMTMPLKMYLANSTYLYVCDPGTQRISKFNLEGTYLDSFNLLKNLNNPSGGFAINNDGHFIISSFTRSDDKIIHIFDKDGKCIRSFGMPLTFSQSISYPDYSTKTNYSTGALAIADNTIYYAQRNPYEIRQYINRRYHPIYHHSSLMR